MGTKEISFILETEKEITKIDSCIRGAAIHPGVPIVDIFYKDCQHATSLRFKSQDEAVMAYEKVREFIKKTV
jgi:hypothetical protein